MSTTDPYAPLMAHLGYPDSDRFRALLKNMMNEKQATIVAALPGTVEDTAQKVGKTKAEVQETLDKLFFDGVVIPRGDFVTRDYFKFARVMGQFHDATQASQMKDVEKDKEFYRLWHDFVINEWYPDKARDSVAAEVPRERVVPAYQAVKDLPDLLPHENFEEMLKAQDLIAMVPCSCRYRTTSIDEQCDYTSEVGRWNCVQFNRNAEYAIKRGSGIQLSIDEALEWNKKVEEDGLIHMWYNFDILAGAPVSCQCCRDCCMNYVPMDIAEESIGHVWAKSRFLVEVDQDKCTGCQDCVDRCQFDAIEMKRIKTPTTKKGKKGKLKSTIIDENCWGCGVCVLACDEANAMSMKAIRPPEHIPKYESAKKG